MSEINSDVPSTLEHVATSTTLPRKRELAINRPGNINWAGEKGAYPGCRLIEVHGEGIEGLEQADQDNFTKQVEDDGGFAKHDVASLANLFFKHRANLLSINTCIDAAGSFWVLYTNQLEGDELEDFQEYSSFVSAHMEEYREKRAAARAKEDEARVAQGKTLEDLAILGRQAQVGDWKKKIENLTDEVERQRKAINKLERKAK